MTLKEFIDEWNNDEPTVLVHTSGSTGKPKPLRVEKLRIAANTGASLSPRSGCPHGSTVKSRKPHTSERTTTILPAI